MGYENKRKNILTGKICFIVLMVLILSFSLVWSREKIPGVQGPAGKETVQGTTTAGIAVHADLLVTAMDVLKKERAGKRPMLIDVRNKADFESFRIPGSINLPLFAVKTKSMFKQASIVLLNEGYALSPLIRECEILREKGFDAFVLFGGLTAWKNSNGLIDGNYFEIKKVNQVPARIWFSERKTNCWISIDASNYTPLETAPPKLPQGKIIESLIVPFSGNGESFAKAFSQAVNDQERPGQLCSLLVFTKDGKDYGPIEKALKDFPNLFFLEDGLVGVDTFLKNQELAKNRKTIRQGKKCRTCP
ncbi:rhodanese-like domain-containing protein [uncultured Desulfobacter sp.]|uniref:rhodanese-like domain-containing protein n=1 Tax=uncultured Desulfobacter sp. TaxID=240139 RepID=UPI002AA69FA5|nr:rhodanese-like domain-containing protein [uncultured Desulfobacter sp.]